MAESGEIRQKTTMREQRLVLGNYPNFKQHLAGKENFFNPKNK